jgi:alanine dehydrogenase
MKIGVARDAIAGERRVLYCLPDMPSAVPSTWTRSLMSATIPYIRKLAMLGIDEAIATHGGG